LEPQSDFAGAKALKVPLINLKNVPELVDWRQRAGQIELPECLASRVTQGLMTVTVTVEVYQD
jgi:hypothetical protein